MKIRSWTVHKKPSTSALTPATASAAKVPVTPPQITEEQAIEIVRQDMAKKPGREFDCKAVESQDGYRVYVDFGSGRDENGRLTGQFPGSHSAYDVSKQGSIIKIHPGI